MAAVVSTICPSICFEFLNRSVSEPEGKSYQFYWSFPIPKLKPRGVLKRISFWEEPIFWCELIFLVCFNFPGKLCKSECKSDWFFNSGRYTFAEPCSGNTAFDSSESESVKLTWELERTLWWPLLKFLAKTPLNFPTGSDMPLRRF